MRKVTEKERNTLLGVSVLGFFDLVLVKFLTSSTGTLSDTMFFIGFSISVFLAIVMLTILLYLQLKWWGIYEA